MKKIYLTLLVFLASCGTLFSDSDQDVSFDSNVKGVKIYVDGMEICKTPCVYPLERKSSTSVVIAKKEGYEAGQARKRERQKRGKNLLTDKATCLKYALP